MKMAGVAFATLNRTGDDPAATGNRHPTWAPQGCYPARGEDQWIVVSCTDDAEWAACAELIGRPDLAALSLDERRARHDEIDMAIGEWTRAGRREGGRRRPAGGRACPPGGCSTCARSRTTRTCTPGASGSGSRTRRCTRTASSGVAWRLVEANPAITSHAPYFGAHNHEVLASVAGLSAEAIAQLEADGVIADSLGSVSYG